MSSRYEFTSRSRDEFVTLCRDLPRPSIPAAVDVAGKSASVDKRASGPFQCLWSCSNIANYIINETWCRHLLLGQKSLWLCGLSLAYYLQTSPTFGMGSQLFSPSDWTHSRIKPHTHGQHIGRYELHTILIIGKFVSAILYNVPCLGMLYLILFPFCLQHFEWGNGIA